MSERVPWGKVFFHYFLIGIAGTAAVLVGCAYFNAVRAQALLDEAERLIDRDRPETALARVAAAETVAVYHPSLARRAGVLAVRALCAQGRYNDAEARAETMRSGTPLSPPSSGASLAALRDLSAPLVNHLLDAGDGTRLTRWAGYEAFIAEMMARDQQDRLAELPTDVLMRRTTEPSASPSAGSPPATVPDRTAARPRPLPTAPSSQPDQTADPATAAAPSAPTAAAAAPADGESEASDDNGQWAIAAEETVRVYDLSGKFLRRVPAGTVFEVMRTKDSSSGAVAICDAMHPGRLGAPILVLLSEVELYNGSLSGVSERERDLHIRRVRLLVQLEKARQQPNPRNPHAAELARVQQAHRAYWRRVQQLQKKRDAAAEGDHVAYADELRSMKGEDIRLAQALEQAREKYNRWNQAHPEAADSNPAVQRIRKEIAAVDQALRTL